MTKRYFYTDPLAAAWMAKHFGMRHGFIDAAGEFNEFVVPISGDDDKWRTQGESIYVHSDSLHLLEPQVGDVFVSDRGLGKIMVPAAARRCSDQIKGDNAKIVTRRGRAFMWPDCEEV
jgi:hypothetical protein